MVKLRILLPFLALCISALANPLLRDDLQDLETDNITLTLSRVARQLPKHSEYFVSHAVVKMLFGLMTAYMTAGGSSSTETEKEKDKNVCEIDFKRLGMDNPLILNKGTDDAERYVLRQPDARGKMSFFEGESVYVSCSTHQYLNVENIAGASHHTAIHGIDVSCIKGTMFRIKDSKSDEGFHFPDLKCYDIVQYSIKASDENMGSAKGFFPFFIGFDIKDDFFLPYIAGWANSKTATTSWVQSKVSKLTSNAKQKTHDGRKIGWNKSAATRNVNLDAMYIPANQQANVKAMFFCDEYPNNPTCGYLDNIDYVFNRGHLTPKSSFLYTVQSMSTFSYINTGPQSKVINRELWTEVEKQVNTLAYIVTDGNELDVVTGVYDHLMWLNHAEEEIPVYLRAPAIAEGIPDLYVPIPKYFWKLAINHGQNKGVVYININNPHLKKEDIEDHYLCDSPIQLGDERLGQLSPTFRNEETSENSGIYNGFTYACSAKDFIQHVPDLPNIEYLNILVEPLYSDVLKVAKGGSSKKSENRTKRPPPRVVSTTRMPTARQEGDLRKLISHY